MDYLPWLRFPDRIECMHVQQRTMVILQIRNETQGSKNKC